MKWELRFSELGGTTVLSQSLGLVAYLGGDFRSVSELSRLAQRLEFGYGRNHRRFGRFDPFLSWLGRTLSL